VEAYGTVDELSAHLALLADMIGAEIPDFEYLPRFADIQRELMVVEAVLATGSGGDKGKRMELDPESVARLENEIDSMNETLAPVGGFVIPGGHPIVSQSHICRTVCRRAERAISAISDKYDTPSMVFAYINRLSDWLYTLGRVLVKKLLVKDSYWIP
jgi:cob(I)alamin adenosyltransferase